MTNSTDYKTEKLKSKSQLQYLLKTSIMDLTIVTAELLLSAFFKIFEKKKNQQKTITTLNTCNNRFDLQLFDDHTIAPIL